MMPFYYLFFISLCCLIFFLKVLQTVHLEKVIFFLAHLIVFIVLTKAGREPFGLVVVVKDLLF